MKLPIQVVFRNMDPTESAAARARSLAAKLDRYYKNIMACRIVIETDHRHHYKGKLYHVRIDLTLPNTELVASRESSDNRAHENIYVAIRDAFSAIKRQLMDYVHKLRGQVKHHSKHNFGKVVEICPNADFAYFETIDGRRLRFSSNSVVGYDFNKLEIGDRIRYVEAEMDFELEPSASTIYFKQNYNHA